MSGSSRETGRGLGKKKRGGENRAPPESSVHKPGLHQWENTGSGKRWGKHQRIPPPHVRMKKEADHAGREECDFPEQFKEGLTHERYGVNKPRKTGGLLMTLPVSGRKIQEKSRKGPPKKKLARTSADLAQS